jgi:hypothetical protein
MVHPSREHFTAREFALLFGAAQARVHSAARVDNRSALMTKTLR